MSLGPRDALADASIDKGGHLYSTGSSAQQGKNQSTVQVVLLDGFYSPSPKLFDLGQG
jgi:hypothetical protein